MYKIIACDLDETLLCDDRSVSQKNKEAILKAIKKYGSNTESMKKVADVLDIGIATLYRKVKKYNIK